MARINPQTPAGQELIDETNDAVRVNVVAGTAGAAAGTEFAEDAAHTTGDKGVMLLAVRKDSAAALATTDGDYIPLTTDSTGRVRVAALPANSGVDIGDVDVTSISAGTNLIGKVGIDQATANANEVVVKSGTVTTVSTVTSVTGITNALPAGTNNIGDVDVAEKTIVAVSGTSAASGAIVSSPGAGSRLVVTMYQLQNEVATEQTAQLHEKSTATKGIRLFAPAANAGFGTRESLPAGREWKLAEDKDLVLTLAAETTVGWSVRYYTEAV